jgi:hypothetical protein
MSTGVPGTHYSTRNRQNFDRVDNEIEFRTGCSIWFHTLWTWFEGLRIVTTDRNRERACEEEASEEILY